MQIRRVQPFATGHGHRRCAQRLAEGPHHIGRRDARWVEDHDDGPRGAADPGLQRVAGTERLRRQDQLIDPGHGAHVAIRHEHQLRARGAVSSQRIHGRGGRRAARASDDDDARCRRRHLVQSRGHRCDRAVEAPVVLDDVRGHQRLKVEGRPIVDHLPTSDLDARLELVGARPVLLDARSHALLGQQDDVGGC